VMLKQKAKLLLQEYLIFLIKNDFPFINEALNLATHILSKPLL